MQKSKVDWHWLPISIISFLLLIVHTFDLFKAKIDNTSLYFVIVMLLSPYISALKKLKFGELEAEINTKEVQEVTHDAQNVLSKTSNEKKEEELPEDLKQLIARIYGLVSSDRIWALATLRFELDKSIREIYRRNSLGNSHPKDRTLTVESISHKLAESEKIQSDLLPVIRKVMTMCNRALHGQSISEDDAYQVVEIGTDLLKSLYQALSYFVPDPVETVLIHDEEVSQYESGTYRVTTVIPYVKNPQRRTYVLEHDDLEAFFEGYHEYAEFIVEISKTS